MKVAIFLVLSVTYFIGVNAHGRGCSRILGSCREECPEGTHEYGSSCRSPTWSERTCDSPNAHDMGAICDLSRCDCDEPTVKDASTGKCVKLEDCPLATVDEDN